MALAKEIQNQVLVYRALPQQTLTSATADSYDNSPVGIGGSIDSWSSDGDPDSPVVDKYRFSQGMIIVDVLSMTGTSLTVSLRDDNAALTAANGDANSVLAFTATAITEAGTYVIPFRFSHVFQPGDEGRGATAEVQESIQRYLSVRATAAGGNAVFVAMLLLGGNLGDFPTQGNELAVTWNT
jgi:hypothetical protein